MEAEEQEHVDRIDVAVAFEKESLKDVLELVGLVEHPLDVGLVDDFKSEESIQLAFDIVDEDFHIDGTVIHKGVFKAVERKGEKLPPSDKGKLYFS